MCLHMDNLQTESHVHVDGDRQELQNPKNLCWW